MSKKIQRKLAAIVSADVVGYSRLMGVDEAGTLAAMQAHRNELWEPLTRRFGGRIVGTAGDGQLIEFTSAVAAVECSVAIQRGMLERNAELPDQRRMLLRIGINMGEVIVAGEDLFGDSVNIAARLQELCETGAIAIADIVHGQVYDKLDVTFVDDGKHEAKNIARPVHVWRWVFNDIPSLPGTRVDASILPDKPSIAVLPFENMSGDPEQEYFADGMAEDIITALSRIDMLFVIARNSSFTYKGRAVDIRQVARELGVRYLLEGSVRRAGNRVRITSQLIEAENGNHLWADKFDGALQDIFELQDQIAESVAGILEPTLRTAEIERSRRKRPDNLDAYDLYLQALPMVFSFRADENQRAIDLLDRAIQIDPNLAPSPALKAWCMTQRAAAGWKARDPEYQAEAADLARLAIAADDQNAFSLATAGFALTVMGRDHRGGVAAVRRALELNGNSAYVCMHAGYTLSFDDQAEEAINLLQRARRLSPIDPLNYHFLQGIATAQLAARHPDEAYEYGLRSIAENGNWTVSNRFLASSCGHLGRIDEGKLYLSRINARQSISALRDWTPYRSNETLEYFLDGLRKVGLPEE